MGKLSISKKKAILLTFVGCCLFSVLEKSWYPSLHSRRSLFVSKKPVELVHITKTGGSALEHAAALHGVLWGACHYGPSNPNSSLGLDCGQARIPFDFKYHRHKDVNEDALPEEARRLHFIVREPWHTPPHWFKVNPFQNAITFVVVRDPYTRVVSEYYCNWAGARFATSEEKEDPVNMNRWVRARLNKIFKRQMESHFLPQHYYTHDKDGNQVIDYILRQEHLNADLRWLMEKYDLRIKIPNNTNHRTSTALLTPKDFELETICLINKYYQQDFEEFGYPMIAVEDCSMLESYDHKKEELLAKHTGKDTNQSGQLGKQEKEEAITE